MGIFRRISSTFLFICSTWTEVQNTRNLSSSKMKRKNKTDVQNLENILRIPFGYLGVFHLDFFGTTRLFWKFLDCTKECPLHLFRHFATEWMLKNPKGSPVLHFSALWHCTNFFKVSKGSPSFFLFCNNWSFKKPKGSPLYNFKNFALFEP